MDPRERAAAAQMTVAEFCAEEQQLHRRASRPPARPSTHRSGGGCIPYAGGGHAGGEGGGAGRERPNCAEANSSTWKIMQHIHPPSEGGRREEFQFCRHRPQRGSFSSSSSSLASRHPA